LASVLGEESAGLLIKTIDQTPILEHAIVPRTILAWLQASPSFEGQVLDGIDMAFEKSESGFTGAIGMGGESYAFEAANVFHVGASVAVALGMEELESEGLRTLDIERLGKTIDLMCKAHRVTVELEKADSLSPCKECGGVGSHPKTCQTALKNPKVKKDEADAGDLDKAIGDSAPPAAPTAAKPQKAGAPKAATVAAPKASIPKATSTSTMSLTRSEAATACSDCAGHQFVDDKFVGCICFEAIAKAVKVKSATGAGLVLELDRRALEQDDVDALADAFKTGVIDGK
jgi:hypothetical protein